MSVQNLFALTLKNVEIFLKQKSEYWDEISIGIYDAT